MIDEMKEARREVVLFIDETAHRGGCRARREGGLDAANIMKPALARGELQVIGATTPDEYRKHIEKDAALERRFQTIWLEEPTVDQTIEILRATAPPLRGASQRAVGRRRARRGGAPERALHLRPEHAPTRRWT